MNVSSNRVRLVVALLAVTLIPWVGFQTASATSVASTKQHTVHDYGKVISVSRAKKTQDVTGFDLQLRPTGPKLSFKVNAQTQFVARSSEAYVAGFSAGDYANVSGHLVKKGRLADSVEFDTHSFQVFPESNFNGTVTKVGAHDGPLVIQVSGGSTRRIFRSKDTQYYVNGQPSETPIQINVGDNLQIAAERRAARWIAVTINDLG